MMIDKAAAMETVLTRLKKLPLNHAIDLRTFKRDRYVVIRRVADDQFDVARNGYERKRYSEPLKRMRKLLKTLLKKEFPRSNKIRLYDLGEDVECTKIR